MRRAELFRSFFTAALERYRVGNGDDDLFYWLLGGALASFPERRREMEARLRIVEAIAARLRGRVLDVGCGTGVFSLLFAAAPGVREVVGMDTGERFLAARDAAVEMGLPVEFVRADFLESRPGDAFDGITFVWVLHDVSDPRPYLERALSLLRAGGVILVGDVDFRGMRPAIAAFARDRGLGLSLEDHGEVASHGHVAPAFLAELRRG